MGNRKTQNQAMSTLSKWATSCATSMQQENAKLSQQVANQHSEMVKWMVQILLRIAPGRSDSSDEGNELQLLGTLPLADLEVKYSQLSTMLDRFTKILER